MTVFKPKVNILLAVIYSFCSIWVPVSAQAMRINTLFCLPSKDADVLKLPQVG